jgi:hypothetical protein
MTSESVRRLAAAEAVLAEFERLCRLVGDRPELLAHLYAGAAVRADDERGRDAGMVVQADELRWTELQQLLRLAQIEAQIRAEAGGHAVGAHPGCPDCAAITAVTRIRSRATAAAHPPPPDETG